MEPNKPYEIVDVWLVGDTDGYIHNFNDNLAATTESEAEILAQAKHKGYGVVGHRKAIKINNDHFVIESTEPLDINGERSKIKKKLVNKL